MSTYTKMSRRDYVWEGFCPTFHREICVSSFSGTTVPMIWKFGTNVGYDLYCVKENQHGAAKRCLICPFFFLSKQIFCYKFLSFYESQSSNFVYTLRVAKYIVDQKTELIFIGIPVMPSFSFFPSLFAGYKAGVVLPRTTHGGSRLGGGITKGETQVL